MKLIYLSLCLIVSLICNGTANAQDPMPNAALLETSPPARLNDAQLLFERLKTLHGQWRIADPPRDTKVSFEVIANGSAVVESWTMSPTRSSMTVYFLDGDRLLSTHYCPQGNAPTLAYSATDDAGLHHFKFVNGANLQSKEGSHQHSFWIRFDTDESFSRSETYIKNGEKNDSGKPEDRPQKFVRVKQ